MYQALWAKRRKSIQGKEALDFHPLLFHLMDVATVTECLWRSVLERQLRKEFSARLDLKAEQVGKWIGFWAGLHDLGKASPAFQGKWEPARDRLEAAGLRCPRLRNPLPHGFLTAVFIPELLSSGFLGFPSTLAGRLGRALGGHHGNFPRSGDLQAIAKAKDQRGGSKWKEVRLRLFQQFAKQFPLEDAGMPRDDPGNSFFILLAGLVSVADWIGSNADYFPFAGDGLDVETYASTVREKAETALKALGWLGWRLPPGFVSMEELFPAVRVYGLRPLQQASARLAESLSEPGLVILEAPMGEGKTEAAMYLADHWAVALGQRGCYFALPTMATSNQMFGRVKGFLKDRYPDDLVNFQLLHGHASLSAEFRVLREQADRLFTPTDIEAEQKGTTSTTPAEVVAAEWFTYRKRGLLAPFGVGTVDQALLAVLKTRHYFVRLFGLAGKTVIIDEVHAYDAYMMKLLERLLEWLAACGCGVVLLSATLPKIRRQALVEAFAKGLGADAAHQQLRQEPYPRLTWLSHASSGVEHFPASRQFTRTLRCEWIDGAIPMETGQVFPLGSRLQAVLAEGGCAAVICNTVGRAQEVYRALKPYFPDLDVDDGHDELNLFHARYLYEDREKREGQALRRFGKPSDLKVRRPRRAVLVATQVIEQSLDLDFDLMVTEMAPVDLLLQRAGRLHRHVRPRPDKLQEPSLWIMAPESEGGVPFFDPGTEAVYERHILLRSWLALKDRPAVAIPGDMEFLIEKVYDESPPPTGLAPALIQAWEESLKILQGDLRHDAAEALFRYISPPYYRDDILEDRNPELEEDAPEVHKSLQAATRLGAPGVSLICLYGDGVKVALDPKGCRTINLQEKPSGEATRALLHRSVTLSHRGLVPWLINNGERPPGWQKHPLLCRCRLVRLDENHAWRGDGYELRLSPEEGIVITKRKKEE